MTEALVGGCACGAVRFRVAGPVLGTVVCHCASCRRAAGAPLVPWTTVSTPGLRWTRGSLRLRESSRGVTRGHCADCGTTLSYARAELAAAETDLVTTAFDDAALLVPAAHIHGDDDLPWIGALAGLPLYARSSSDRVLLPASRGLVLERVEFATAREALMAVRLAVFVQEQGVPMDIEADERDAHCVHVLARDAAGRPVATGRLDVAREGKIGRVAVLRELRGQGVGAAVMQQLHRLARGAGLAQVWCHAQLSAAPFYERLGYAREGEAFEEAGIAHVGMRAQLARVAP